MGVALRRLTTGVAGLAAGEGAGREVRGTDEAALRAVRARAVARAEIDAFLAVHEVSSLACFASAKCAALVRAWSALASMEMVVGDAIAGARPRVPGALAEVPADLVARVVACAQGEPWGGMAAPSDRQLDVQCRLLLRALADLD